MSILISCACGKSYPIKEEFAGQRVQCPACKRVLSIPGQGVRKAPPSESVIDLFPVPPPRRSEPVVDLPVLDLPVFADAGDPPPRSSNGLALPIALGFVLLIAAAGAGFYIYSQRKGAAPSPPVAAADKNKDEPKKPTDDKKEPEKKEPVEPKKDPVEPMPPVDAAPWRGHSARLLNVGFTRDGRVAFSGSGGEVTRDDQKVPASDSSIRAWDPATGKELKRLDGFERGLSLTTFDPTGALAATSGLTDSFEVHLWDLAMKRDAHTLKTPDRGVFSAVFTPDGRQLLTGSKDGHLRVWDTAQGTQLHELPAHPGYICGLAVSNDGRLAISACSDRAVRIFDLVERKLVKELARHQDIVWAVALSPDGRFAASGGGGDYDGTLGRFVPGSRDYEIRLWDVATGQEVRRFRGHGDEVHSLAFSPDGRRLLSAGFDKTVRLWHVASGRELGRFTEHTEAVQCVAFFPDARRSLSGGYDKTLRVWTLPVDVGELVKRLQDPAANRFATLRELGDYGPEARDAVPALLKLLRESDDSVKRAAMDTLRKIGTVGKEHVELLIPLVKDAGFPEGRRYAVDALVALGPDARPATAEAVALLKDPGKDWRLKAIAILGAVGPDAKSAAFSPLLELLRDPDAETAKAAGEALGKLGKPTKAELPALTAFLSDKGEPVRRYAIVAITDLGPEARDSLPAVLNVLEKDGTAAMRMLALVALLKVQTEKRALIDPLTKALQDNDPKLAEKAAEALAALPPETGVLPSLVKALETDNPGVQKIADDALEKFPFTKEHVKVVNDGLQSKREAVRLRMLAAVAKLGPDAAGAVPGLIAIVKTYAGEMRATAVKALGDLGPAAKNAGPVLVPLLKNDDRKVRLGICLVLAKIEADEAKLAVPFLVAMLKLENPTDEEAKKDRDTAHETLVQIAEPAIDDLLKALTDEFAGGNPNMPIGVINAEARLVVIQTLSKIAKKTKKPIRKALAPLAKVQKDDLFLQVREAAKQAFKDVQQ